MRFAVRMVSASLTAGSGNRGGDPVGGALPGSQGAGAIAGRASCLLPSDKLSRFTALCQSWACCRTKRPLLAMSWIFRFHARVGFAATVLKQ